MVHVRDHGHVTDVVLLVHDLAQLVCREVNLRTVEVWRGQHGSRARHKAKGTNEKAEL